MRAAFVALVLLDLTATAHALPHTSMIRDVVLAPDGRSALSADVTGRVRLWRALDGTAEPLAVAVVQPMELALADPEAGEQRLAVLDSANVVHVYAVDASGVTHRRGGTAPVVRVLAMRLLPHGRFVTLEAGGSVRVYTDAGQVVASVDRRDFHAVRLFLANATTFVAVADGAKTTFQRVRFSETSKSLAFAGEPVTIDLQANAVMAVSPDGRRVAFARNAAPFVLDLETKAERHTVLPVENQPIVALGFVAPDQLLVTPGNAPPFVVDLGHDDAASPELARGGPVAPAGEQPASGGMAPPAQPQGPSAHKPVAIAPQPVLVVTPPHAFGPAMHVAGHGTWLFVQDLATQRHLYLGYESYTQSITALSQDGAMLAFVHDGTLVVEEVASGRHLALLRASTPSLTNIVFVDPDHLITVDISGGLRLIDIAADRITAQGDAAGPIAAVELEPSSRLLRVQRQSGETSVFELAADRFLPHLIVDGSNLSGLLPAARPEDPVLWTRDAAGAIRRFTRADLAAARTPAPVATEPVGPSESVLAMDRSGARYVLVSPPTGMTVERRLGGSTHAAEVVDTSMYLVVPSPTGETVAMFTSTGMLSVYRADGMKRLWTMHVQSTVQPAFSADGRRLAIAVVNGMMVLDAATGERVLSECAGAFVARVTPPIDPIASGMNQVSVCEP
jgi:hypothetical protein